MDNETTGFVATEGSFTVVETPGIIPFFPSIMVAQSDEFNATECFCSDLQHEDYSPLYAWFNYIVIIIMLPSLSAFGVITNVVNVFVYSRCRMRNSSNTYLLFLACSDFFVVITGLFIFWIDSARSYIPQLVQAPYTTVYTLPFGYMAQSCSIYFTVAAAFDCYVCVCWRLKAKWHCTVKRAQRIVVQFAPLHPRGQQVYLYMIVMTVFPFSVLLFLNLLIIWRKSVEANQIRKKKKRPANTKSPTRQTRKGRSVLTKHSLRRHYGFQRNSQRYQPQPHIAAALLGGTLAQFPPLPKATPGSDETITMIMVVVLFLCCNTLALIVNLIETFFEPDALLLNLLSDASNFLVIFNSSVNCVIYLIFNSDYREVFLFVYNIRQRFLCIRPPPKRETEGPDERKNGGIGKEMPEKRVKGLAVAESPVWLPPDHHHFCHCSCNCPLLIRCARVPTSEKREGEDGDSGCDEDGGGHEGGRSRGSSNQQQQRLLSSSKVCCPRPLPFPPNRQGSPLPSVPRHHPTPTLSAAISSCYLAEVKIVPSNCGYEDNGTTNSNPSPPHIYVRPLLRKKRMEENSEREREDEETEAPI
uniref:G_PROTEIN_RECEP_F1_2 domain-containing protein n=1 Tax=Globodera pallida TaxID=36090 RepID=A0A183CG25_GLOPA